MKIKVKEIIDLQKILSEIGEAKTNIALAYKMARIKKKIMEEIDTFEENRKTIVMDYVEKDENGAPIIEDNMYKMIDTSKSAELNQKLEELYNIEIDIDIPKIKISELTMEITTNQMEKLMPVIEE